MSLTSQSRRVALLHPSLLVRRGIQVSGALDSAWFVGGSWGQFLGRVNGVAFTLYWTLVAPASFLMGLLVSVSSAKTGILVAGAGIGLLGLASLFTPYMTLLDTNEKEDAHAKDHP